MPTFPYDTPNELFRCIIWRIDAPDSIHQLLHIKLFGTPHEELALSKAQNILFNNAWIIALELTNYAVTWSINYSVPEFPPAEEVVEETIKILIRDCQEELEAARVLLK